MWVLQLLKNWSIDYDFDVEFFLHYLQRLFQIWSERAESANKLSSEVVSNTFHDMDIFPSSSQVHEMLHCANECSKRPNADYITFGEFCVYASELRSCYDSKIPRPTPLSKSTKETRRLSNKRRSITTRSPAKHEVFLGGSCNPTTWRKDIAIPTFRDIHNISCYNPQVANWGPELINLENEAKQNAEVMFFVIDNQTRSVASMIEAAQVAGTSRKLIVVVHEFEKPGSVVMGESITETEFRDLQQGQRYLQDLVERQGIPVFNNIPHAIQCTATVVKNKIQPQALTINDAAKPVKMAYLQIGDRLIKLRKVFDNLDSSGCGQITLKDVCMAFKIVTGAELSIEDLKDVVARQNGLLVGSSEMNDTNFLVDFNQFCCMMTEFRNQAESCSQLENLKNKASHLLCSVLTPLSKLVDWAQPERSSKSKQINATDIVYDNKCCDIYLGGTKKSSAWREEIAIPMLKKKGLSYFVPQDGIWSERLIPIEVTKMENSQVLLFIITDNSRSLADMIVAAHYVGVGCQVVLCLQYIPDEIEIEGEKLSSQAVKDYNRGRVYLSDMATRAGVPVFDKIDEAVDCAMKLCFQD